MSENGTMSVAEAARALGISIELVKRGIASGELPIGDHVGDRWIIYRGAVERRIQYGPSASAAPVDPKELAREVAVEMVRLQAAGVSAQVEALKR